MILKYLVANAAIVPQSETVENERGTMTQTWNDLRVEFTAHEHGGSSIIINVPESTSGYVVGEIIEVPFPGKAE